MSKRSDIWMPLYIGDYLADTSRLSTEQHGAYLLILMDYWRNGPPLDDDEELASITKLPLPQWRKHAAKLRVFFASVDGRLVQKRADEERQRAGAVSTKRGEAGKAGAASKWGGQPDAPAAATRSARLAAARAKGKHTKQEWDALQWATGYRCVSCGIGADDLEGGVLTKDHIIPIYQGGSDAIENIQPSCRTCNSRKGDDTTDHRETSSPGWRKRMAECLPNAWQTPAPSQSHSQPLKQDGEFSTGVAPGTQLPPDPPGDADPPPTPSLAGRACLACRGANVHDVNPSHPDLLRLLAAGVTPEDIGATAAECAGKGKARFAYVLATVERRRSEAAAKTAAQAAPPLTVPSDEATKTADLLREQSQRIATKPPAALLELAGKAVRTA